jgi:hypothetical protein
MSSTVTLAFERGQLSNGFHEALDCIIVSKVKKEEVSLGFAII